MRVRHGSVSFNVRDGEYDAFWRRLDEGRWENETFDVFDRYIRPATTVIDFGAWIGPTTLYAARGAGRVLAFEPDPVAFRELAANLAANPDITNVEIRNAAIATARGEVQLGAREKAGDSTSSILLAGEGGMSATAISFADALARTRDDEPLFVKMDVEGYEFELLPGVLDLLRERDAVVYVSLHPHFLALGAGQSLRRRGGVGRLLGKAVTVTVGRWRAWRATRRLGEVLAAYGAVYDDAGEKIDVRRHVWRVLLGKHLTARSHSLIIPSPRARR